MSHLRDRRLLLPLILPRPPRLLLPLFPHPRLRLLRPPLLRLLPPLRCVPHRLHPRRFPPFAPFSQPQFVSPMKQKIRVTNRRKFYLSEIKVLDELRC